MPQPFIFHFTPTLQSSVGRVRHYRTVADHVNSHIQRVPTPKYPFYCSRPLWISHASRMNDFVRAGLAHFVENSDNTPEISWNRSNMTENRQNDYPLYSVRSSISSLILGMLDGDQSFGVCCRCIGRGAITISIQYFIIYESSAINIRITSEY